MDLMLEVLVGVQKKETNFKKKNNFFLLKVAGPARASRWSIWLAAGF
jgi:hypothetical protein